MSINESRRAFLQASAVGLSTIGASYWLTNRARADAPSKSPNEQPVLGFIGCGIRYHEDLGHAAMKFGPCAAIADVDALQAGRALQVAFDEHRTLDRPLAVDVYEDYRHILDRPEINAVFIATPDHWHTKIAIDAMNAGKDVYCEKPLTLTIREGQQFIEAEKKTNRIVQVGTIQRTEFNNMFATAVALVGAGRIGKLKRITCAIGPARKCNPLPVKPAPKTLNWELWQGQTPLVDYRQGPLGDAKGYGAGHPLSRTHNYFRWWYEYSGGKLTDWGAHHVDIAVWALDQVRKGLGQVAIEPLAAEHPVPLKAGMPTAADRFNTAVTFNVKCTLDDGVELHIRDKAGDLGFDNGVLFEGESGRLFVNRGKLSGKPVEDLKSNPLPADYLKKLYGMDPPASHVANFFDCTKSRKTPIADTASHHRALSICHAVNIALRLGRKLTYDTGKEQFVVDAQANTFIERPQRKGYEIKV
jgi:predicted dehydrogenase